MEKAAQKVMGGLVDLHGKSLTEKPEGFIDKDEVPHAWHYLVNPGSSITGRCMLEGNDLTVLHNGEAAYPVMLKAISEAKERVFLSSFIFGYDEVGKSFAAALRAAAERGCDVRLLMDGVGSFHLWPSWRKRLGPDVKLAYFLPPRLIPPQFSINLRTHRKVLICDSETGFTGGMNISQNHLANLKRRSRVQDVHFRCLGPIAQQLEIAGSGERIRNLAQNELGMLRRERAQTETIYIQAPDKKAREEAQTVGQTHMEILDFLLGLLNVFHIGE